MKFKTMVIHFNDKVAIYLTKKFGTMWVTYLCFVYGLAPIFFPDYMEKLLYWSNTVQLWSLPLLMVGTNLLGRAAERRAKETHDAVMKIMEEMKELLTKEGGKYE